LRSLEQRKARDEERRAALLAELRGKRGPSEEEIALAASGKRARVEGDDGDDDDDDDDAVGGESRRSRHAAGALRGVVEDADIVLEVLDARDPGGCRSREVEDLVLSQNKRLVFVLNKADLVPEAAANGWLAALKAEHPCVLFRAAASSSHSSHKAKRGATGVDDLVRLLKHISKSEAGGGNAGVVVGVVGPPNVGKSSLVNALKMRKAVVASAQAGSTKTAQLVQIDQKLQLIDTPGVASRATTQASSAAVAALRAALLPNVSDALACVTELVAHLPAERFMEEYGLARFESPTDFLVVLARQSGRLGKGGVLDLESTARVVLNDVQRGKLRLFVAPPPSAAAGAAASAAGTDAVVLSQMDEEFQFAADDDDDDDNGVQ